MSKTLCLLAALAALACAGAPAQASPTSHDRAATAPVAALAGEFRPASDVIPADLGTPSLGNAEQHIAKTGIWSSVKSAAKKVGGAVKRAAKVVARAAVKYVPKFPPINGVIQGYKAAKHFIKRAVR